MLKLLVLLAYIVALIQFVIFRVNEYEFPAEYPYFIKKALYNCLCGVGALRYTIINPVCYSIFSQQSLGIKFIWSLPSVFMSLSFLYYLCRAIIEHRHLELFLGIKRYVYYDKEKNELHEGDTVIFDCGKKEKLYRAYNGKIGIDATDKKLIEDGKAVPCQDGIKLLTKSDTFKILLEKNK